MNRRAFVIAAMAATITPVSIVAKNAVEYRWNGTEWYENGYIVLEGRSPTEKDARKALKTFAPQDILTLFNLTAESIVEVGTTAEGFTLYDVTFMNGEVAPFISGQSGTYFGFAFSTVSQSTDFGIETLSLKLNDNG